MAIFMPDVDADDIAIRYAAGAHAAGLRGIRRSRGAGIAGWVAVNLRAAVNADPSLDLGYRAADATPALRSCLAVPLVEGEQLVAVLALYRTPRGAFSEDQVRLVELLAPRLATSLATAVLAEEALDQPVQPPSSLTLVRRSVAVGS
jgi:GAF domain-containing protein